jgi:hypothetical protein
MKIATIVTAVALATGGAAFAADHTTYDQPDTARHAAVVKHDDSSAYNSDSHAASRDAREAGHDAKAAGHNFMDRTRNALHRIGQKLRNATHRDHTETAMGKDRNDTRSMGAGGESQGSSRQHRMDNASGDYHAKHDSDKR